MSNLDLSTYSWPTTDRVPSPINDETSSSNNTDQAKKLYLLGKKILLERDED